MKLLPEYELLSAYLDGEVTAAERARVKQLLAESSDARRVLDELKSTSMTVQALPELRLADDLTDRILRQAEHAILSGEGQPEAAQPVSPPETHRYRRLFFRMVTSRGVAWSGAALAIALLIMLSGPQEAERDFARAPEAAIEKTQPAPAAEPRAIPEMRAFDAAGNEALDREAAEDNRAQAEPEPDSDAMLADSAPSVPAETAAPMAAPAPEQPAARAVPVPDKPAALRRSSVASADAGSAPPAGAAGPMVAEKLRDGEQANIRSEVAPPTPLDAKAIDKAQAESELAGSAREFMYGQARGRGAGGGSLSATAPQRRKTDAADELPVLLIHCDVTPEAARRQVLDQVLLDQRIATQEKGKYTEGRRHPALPADALQTAKREEAAMADAPEEEQLADDDSSRLDADQAFDVVYVEATHDQVAAALDQMARTPDQFLAVSVTPAPGVPSQQPLTRFNRHVSQVAAAGRSGKPLSGPVGLSEADEATPKQPKPEAAGEEPQKNGEDRTKEAESVREPGPQPETWNAAPGMARSRQMRAGGQGDGNVRLDLQASDDGRQAGPADLPMPAESPAPLAQPESLEYMARPSDAPAAESRPGKASVGQPSADESVGQDAGSPEYRVLFVLRVVPADLLAAPASPPTAPADVRAESDSAPAATAPAADELPATEPPTP